MGLMNCPDCGKEISDRSITCIHCGCPVREWQAEKEADESRIYVPGNADTRIRGNPDENADPAPFAETPKTMSSAGTDRHVRRNRILAVICILIVAGVGIFFAVRAVSGPDYYREGLNVTKLMGEMLKSDDYAALVGGDYFSSSDQRKTLASYDFSSPLRVYSLRVPDRDEFIRHLVSSGTSGNMQYWNQLPASLQAQLKDRYTVASLPSLINSHSGSETLALASLYIAVYRTDRLKGVDELYYLYVFDQGVCVLVTFSNGSATGQLMLAGHASVSSLSDVRDLVGQYGIDAEEVKH